MRRRSVSKIATAFVLCGGVALGWNFRQDLRGVLRDAYHRAFDKSSVKAAGRGWSEKMPPDFVEFESGKRSHVFFVGEAIFFALSKSAARYEVRNYEAKIVASGAIRDKIEIPAQPPGWYKLYVYGTRDQGEPWHQIVGGTMFCVFRRDARFPALPPKDKTGKEVVSSQVSSDEIMRGVIGMGPQRFRIEDADKVDDAIRNLQIDVDLARKFYLPFDKARHRVLMAAFPNGTRGKEANVRRIVDHFKNDIEYWEPRNEPNGGSRGGDFARNEMKPFYETVKSVSAKLKVLGPGTVSINPQMLEWNDDFFAADGGKYIDAFSFHAYNNVNGDVWLGRKSLNSLMALLKKYNLEKIEKWQTEQGNLAAIYGVYAPAHQARWTMTQMMLFESYGIPKEHNHLWYDRSHGFWDVPTWWENDDGSLNPEAPLMRIWAEELYGTNFDRVLDFGSANNLIIGNSFVGGNKRVISMMSAGATDARVELKVAGAKTLRVVSAWGVARQIPVVDGRVSLTVPELPIYIESSTQSSSTRKGAVAPKIEVVPARWGANLARETGVVVTASQNADRDGKTDGDNDISKVVNGVLDSVYWSQKAGTTPWNAFDPKLPMTIDIALPRAQSVNRVLVFAAPPWQYQASLLDFDVQAEVGGVWKTVKTVKEPAKTWQVFTPTTHTTVDTFHSDRWIFPCVFAPVTTQKIRLLIRDTTFGGGATLQVNDAGGQAWDKKIVMLREVEIYGK